MSPLGICYRPDLCACYGFLSGCIQCSWRLAYSALSSAADVRLCPLNRQPVRKKESKRTGTLSTLCLGVAPSNPPTQPPSTQGASRCPQRRAVLTITVVGKPQPPASSFGSTSKSSGSGSTFDSSGTSDPRIPTLRSIRMTSAFIHLTCPEEIQLQPRRIIAAVAIPQTAYHQVQLRTAQANL